jgi:uncharacterized repeat protein (TIGR01451 family)
VKPGFLRGLGQRAFSLARVEPARGRRAVAVVLGLVVATVFVQAAVAAAQSVPVLGPLEGVPHLAGLDLSPDLFDRIAPLRTDFIQSALGDSAFGVFDAPPRPTQPPIAGRPPGTTTTQPAAPSPTSTTTTTGPIAVTTTTRMNPGLGHSDLVITMRADRATVRTGEPITYTVTVRNIGDRSFAGDFTVQSHIPYGTTDYAPTECDSGSLPSNPRNVCQQTSVPVPGSSDPKVHQIQRSWSFTDTRPLFPGSSVSFTFTVTVDPNVATGTVITDHAHLALTGPDQTTETVKVYVQ